MDVNFREVLNEESDFPLSDTLYEYIISHSEDVTFEKGDALVDIGDINPNIYIIKEGIIRGYMLNNGVEINAYFGMEGTLVCSMQSYWSHDAAIIRVEACCHTKAIRISKEKFDAMMMDSHDFCRWVTGVFMRRSYYDELKVRMMNGDARWRYEWLERCRKELFEKVPLKAIASYLNMTVVHVSRIRKDIFKGGKKPEA